MTAPSTTTARPAATAPPSRMTLEAVTRGKLTKPPRILLYATDGIGKSTFGSRAPAPIFLASEDGTSELDVSRFPEPQTWAEVQAAIAALHGPNDFKTLVLDTLDWIEPLIHRHLCEANGWKDIEAPGYGKGYVAALDQWRILLARLDELRARKGMNIIMLAHAQVRSFKNPIGDDYDRYELKLNAKAGAMLREWADAVLFANYETLTAKQDKRVRGVSTGARFIYTEYRATWDAKNRYGLPEVLPLSWPDLEAAMASGHGAQLEQLRDEVSALLPQVDAETREKAVAYAAKNSNSAEALYKLADRLRAKVALAPATQPAPAGASETTEA